MTAFTVHALPADALARIRARGVDDLGNPLTRLVNTDEEGAPLRCCLREARVGEEIALIAWRPAERGSAYAETGPVFVHPDDCPGYLDGEQYPAAFRHRRQLFRAYDGRGWQVSNTLVDGHDAETHLRALLSDPAVDVVHSHNPMAGCFMFIVRRGGPGAR